MILEQLARICHDIRLIEEEYKLPVHVADGMAASAIEYRHRRETDLAVTLYNVVKKYALEEFDEFDRLLRTRPR
jgi:hypothetical protein